MAPSGIRFRRSRDALLVGAVLLAACAPDPLTPAGARVVFSAAPRAGCALVASLKGSAGYNGRSGETNEEGIEAYLRNEAALKGADTVVITSRRRGAGGEGDTLSEPRGASVSGGCPNCVSMTAAAYRCDPSPPPSPRASSSPSPPPASSQGDPPFPEKAATAALAAAAESARACRPPGGPGGEARVKVTFATSGDVVYAEVVGEPFAGAPVGECVARKFRNAHLPPFSGEARTVEAVVKLGDG